MAEYDRDEIKEKVLCSALLESRGWKVDLRESTSRAIKYRRADGEIIIVNHHGRGWFDPTSQAKGDVFSLAHHLGAQGFPSALQVVAELVGFVPCDPVWQRKSRRGPSVVPSRRWAERSPPTPGSAAWVYLTEARGIPAAIVERAAAAGCLREGPRASMWAAHMDPAGGVVGWEERGPDWRGFAAGGSKTLFHLGEAYARRLCVTEAAIDAMSLAAIEGCRVDSLYASTGGGSVAGQRSVHSCPRCTTGFPGGGCLRRKRPGRRLRRATPGNCGCCGSRVLAPLARGRRLECADQRMMGCVRCGSAAPQRRIDITVRTARSSSARSKTHLARPDTSTADDQFGAAPPSWKP